MFELFIAWATLIGLTVSCAAFLRNASLTANARTQLTQMFCPSDPDDWAQKINQVFLYLFDLLYGGRGDSLLRQSVWGGLLLSLPMLILLRVLVIGDTANLLLFAILLATMIAFVNVIASGRVVRTSVASGLGVLIVVGIASGIWSTIRSGIGILISLLIVSGIVVSSRPIAKLSVHPLKAIGSSLIFIGVVGLIRIDATKSFIEAIGVEGFMLLAFVAFNVFADGISLLETRWVLQKGADAAVKGLLGLLVLDLMLSAAIFLFLPLVLWEIPAFLEAALFQGERPWLGILFWTSFSTSVMFYVFVIAALVARPLAWFMGRIGLVINLSREPVIGMAIAIGFVITLGLGWRREVWLFTIGWHSGGERRTKLLSLFREWSTHLPGLLAHPLLLLIVGALLSSWLIPSITQRWQNHQKELEIKTDLASQISESVTGIVMGVQFAILGAAGQTQEEYDKAYRDWEINRAVIGSHLQAYFPSSQLAQDWDEFSEGITNDFYAASGSSDAAQRTEFRQNFVSLKKNVLIKRDEFVRRVLASRVSVSQ